MAQKKGIRRVKTPPTYLRIEIRASKFKRNFKSPKLKRQVIRRTAAEHVPIAQSSLPVLLIRFEQLQSPKLVPQPSLKLRNILQNHIVQRVQEQNLVRSDDAPNSLQVDNNSPLSP
jgi:hypothetical protein